MTKQMRVNIIGNHRKGTGVSQDVQILHGLIAHVLGKETQIRHIPHYYPQCPEAEVNFFIEVITPSLLSYAAKNIWIPNPEWTYKTWEPYAKMVDEIWVKTHEAEKLFADWGVQTRYIGWSSIDKIEPEKKNYWKAIVPVGKNIWRNPKPIIQVYMATKRKDPSLYRAFPVLHIVHDPHAVPIADIPEEYSEKIKLIKGPIPEKEYDELLQECGLCICLSAAEGFGHAVNEAMSAGCIPLLSPIDAFRELAHEALWVSNKAVLAHPHCLGNLEDVDLESVLDALIIYCTSDFRLKTRKSAVVRAEYEARHQAFVARMEGFLAEFKDIPEHSIEKLLPKEDDLPSVSIVTITKDRRPFIPLAKYCFLSQSYPESKIEWVIVDDGNDQIKDLVSDLPNVTYVLCDEREGGWTIGAKRNLGVERAKHDILVMMDDDDVYPNNSILTRVAMMLAGPKPHECVFSTTIPCYDIHETKSFMNVPPSTLAMADRVSEATLCFTRDFWKNRQFPDQQIAEAGAFIRGREQMCREMSPQDIIVSLTHKKTTSSRKAPAGEPNGCHYGFADELFTLVSEIAESIA
jgi:glycosyltransferase involved in cell wall biosynthesis